jgi:tetratricopeptide (TPR) repeat protein
VAGDPLNLNFKATNCPTCGAKFSAARRRCPRCHTALTVQDPAAAAAFSRRLAQIATGILAGFLVLVAALWLARDPEPSAAVAAPVDPFASRRPAVAPLAAPETALKASEDRAFLEPASQGALAYQSGDMNAALARYQEAIAKNPDDAESFSNLGQVLVRLNRPAEALPQFQRAMALIPDRWAYTFNMARALGLLKRWDEAVTMYRRAQTLFPNDYVTTFNLALALRKKGDLEAAAAEFEKAIALEPNDATFRIALGMTLEGLKKPVEAAAAYEEALRLAPEAPDADIVRKRITQLRSS